MRNNHSDVGLPLAVIELLARAGSIASITLLAMIFFGEESRSHEISRNEWIGLTFFPLGVAIGMIIAWWKEALGSVLTVASLIGFYVVYGYLLQNHIGGWWFIVFSAPGFLFLVHWFLNSAGPKHALS